MSAVIPETLRDLLERRVIAHLATLMPDGRPQVTPVWVEYDGETLLVNTAVGRQKDLNLSRDGRVALSLLDPANAYRYLEIRGTVSERTERNADADIDRLSQKYLGEPYPFRQPGETRVTFRIRPEHTTGMSS